MKELGNYSEEVRKLLKALRNISAFANFALILYYYLWVGTQTERDQLGVCGSSPGELRKGLDEDRDSGDSGEDTVWSHIGARESLWSFLVDESQSLTHGAHSLLGKSTEE